MADRRVSKALRDSVYGYIDLDPLSLKFVDTEQFQRLRDLKQLGLTYLVYPGAVHSRFEHSLGVYHLAGETIDKINSYQGSELGIDEFDIQTVKLAGLLHAVGHGPFGHMIEKECITELFGNWSLVSMTNDMIDHIVEEHNIDIDSDVQKKVKDMIAASSDTTTSNNLKEKRFLYDIVANGRNGIDVDKFDYIVRDSKACGLKCSFKFDRLLQTMRVIGDEICYHANEHLTMPKLFASHTDLHRTVYTHAKVKAIELMLVDALKMSKGLSIWSCLDSPAEYWKLDDSVMKHIETSKDEALKESRDLILRIRRRDLYQFCNEFTVPKDQLQYFKDVTPQDIICSQKAGVVTLKEEDIVVSNIKIDVSGGSKNPLERINFFKDYECEKKSPISDGRISFLLPECCEDKIVRVYSKKPELVEVVSCAFENFLAKKYGIKDLPLKVEDEDPDAYMHKEEYPENVFVSAEPDYAADYVDEEKEFKYEQEYVNEESDEEWDDDDEENRNPKIYEATDSSEETSSSSERKSTDSSGTSTNSSEDEN